MIESYDYSPKKTKSRQVDTIRLLNSFPFQNIINKKTITYCDGFILSSGTYYEINQDDKSKNESEVVYIIEFNYFDETLLGNYKIKSKIEELVNNPECKNPFTLKRKGIYYDPQINVLYLIYLAEDKKIFIEDNSLAFIQKDEDKNLLKLQVFYNYCQIAKIEHDNMREMSFIHPYLIFVENNLIYTIDEAFGILRDCINKYTNFPIYSYFGIFEIDMIHEMEKAKSENTDLFLKPDILLLCALLVYLFRPTITRSSQNFDLTLLEIAKDFYIKDRTKSLLKLISVVKDNESLKKIFLTILSTDYNEISDINRLLKQFVKHFALTSTINLPCSCVMNAFLDQAEPMLNVICISCGVIHCPCCNKDTEHICLEDNINQPSRIKEKLRFEYDMKTLFFESIPEIKEKKIIDSFVKTVEEIYSEFEDKNNTSLRKIRMVESFIENFSTYIENSIKKYDETQYAELTKEMRLLKQSGNYNQNFDITSGLLNKFYKKISSRSVVFKEKDNFDLNEKWQLLSKEMDVFSSFIKDSSEMSNVLLYDRSIQQITEVAKNRMLDFQKLMNTDFFQKYKIAVDNLIEVILQLYTNNNQYPIEQDNILNEYLIQRITNEKFYYKKYFIFYTNDITIYDVEYKEEIPIQLEFQKTNKQFKAVDFGKNFRYLHMKTGIMITGGKGLNKSYMISYIEIKENIHSIKPLPDLLTIHEKHMMVQFNKFNVIVIGGIKSAVCEIFNFALRRWEYLPELNEPRFDACVFLYNNQYLYVFGGMCELDEFCADIEVLDLNKQDSDWEVKEFVLGDNVIRSFRLCGIKRIENDEKSVLILGGETTTGMTFESIEAVQQFNFETCELKLVPENSPIASYEECLLLEIEPNKYNIANLA